MDGEDDTSELVVTRGLQKYSIDTRSLLQELFLQFGAPTQLIYASKEFYTNTTALRIVSKRPDATFLVDYAAHKGDIARLQYLFSIGNNFFSSPASYCAALKSLRFEACAYLRDLWKFGHAEKHGILESFFEELPDSDSLRTEFASVLNTLNHKTLAEFLDFVVCSFNMYHWPNGIQLLLDRLDTTQLPQDFFNCAFQCCRYETRLGTRQTMTEIHSKQEQSFQLVADYAISKNMLNFNTGERFTPLQRACGMSLCPNANLIKKMLHYGADPSFQGTNGLGDAPLYWLMFHRANILKKMRGNKQYALEQNTEATLALLNAGCDVNLYRITPYVFEQPLEIFSLIVNRMSSHLYILQSWNEVKEDFCDPEFMKTVEFSQKWSVLISKFPPSMFSAPYPSGMKTPMDEWALTNLNLSVLNITVKHIGMVDSYELHHKRSTLDKLLAMCTYQKTLDWRRKSFSSISALKEIQGFLQDQCKLFPPRKIFPLGPSIGVKREREEKS
jgi:hypothetical protein